jgi:DNA helicase-2/ATP-dependent DNA helicase PcrA
MPELNDKLKELNPAQKAAVQNLEGPMMIIAGAGSGKTRVLTYRIANLIHHGVDSFRILSLTFTNKASKEMRERIEALVGTEARNIWMGTFHSVFAKILRIEAHKIGYPNDFTIYDTDDSKSLLKTIVNEKKLDPKKYKNSVLLGRISSCKNNFISPDDYKQSPNLLSEDASNDRKYFYDIYEEYCVRCKRAGAMDFDDILLKTYELLDTQPEVLNKYQQKFLHCLVDEYQDTNHIQYLIIKRLAAVHRNLCVVGDDAQSIYAFRGANIKNILNFEKDYPDVKVFKLEHNYRSTKNIVNASSSLIKKNKYQLEKNIYTDNNSGEKIKVFRTINDNEEGVSVANYIFQDKMNLRISNEDIAILYRTNSQSRAFEEALRRLNIQYRIVGGLSFYQRKEIKDIVAYFRLAINPNDEEALKRVINYPARSIGETTINRIGELAGEHKTSYWEIVSNAAYYGFRNRTLTALNDFSTIIKKFIYNAPHKDAYEMAVEIAKTTKILSLLKTDDTVEGKSRLENVEELFSALQEYCARVDIEDSTLGAYLQEVSLLTDADDKKHEGDKVTLMTIHQAKGLEWPVVFIVGLEERLFPNLNRIYEREDLEEERRLFYVAITRAKTKAYISYAKTRFRWGNLDVCEPSRFIDEIDPKYLDFQFGDESKSVNKTSKLESNYSKSTDIKFSLPKPIQTKVSYKAPEDFVPEPVLDAKEGDRIEHIRFGFGFIKSIEKRENNFIFNIVFEEAGEKQIFTKFARMRFAR